MQKALMVAALTPILACGGTHLVCGDGTTQQGQSCVASTLSQADPLIGDWVRAGGDATCTFFGNGEWSNTCFLLDGFAYKWERIYEGRYYIGASYRACDTDATFSADLKTVTLTMYCGTTSPSVAQLNRFR